MKTKMTVQNKSYYEDKAFIDENYIVECCDHIACNSDIKS